MSTNNKTLKKNCPHCGLKNRSLAFACRFCDCPFKTRILARFLTSGLCVILTIYTLFVVFSSLMSGN